MQNAFLMSALFVLCCESNLNPVGVPSIHLCRDCNFCTVYYCFDCDKLVHEDAKPHAREVLRDETHGSAPVPPEEMELCISYCSACNMKFGPGEEWKKLPGKSIAVDIVTAGRGIVTCKVTPFECGRCKIVVGEVAAEYGCIA